MLQRSNGASIAEITRVTQWQPHTVRGFISRALVHDLGLKVARFKRDQARGSRSLHQPGGARPSGRTVATSRLVRLWNGLPGVTPVKRFTDRKTALNRIWKALANGSAKSTTRAKGSRQSRARSEKPMMP